MAKTKKENETPPAAPTPPPPAAAGEASETAGENHGMLRAAGIVGCMTIFSRVLGLWRFRIMAAIFGATGVADAFNFAFVFPNLTRRLFGEGAMTSAFVPVFSDRIAKKDLDGASATASVLLCRLTYWLSLGCIAVALLTAAARYVLPSFTTLRLDDVLMLKLFIVMLPYMVFINLAAVLMGVLNSLGHFAMPAFAPVLLNALMIAACYFALPYFGDTAHRQIWALAVAVLLGGILQVLIQIPPAIARGFKFRLSFDTSDPGYQQVMENFKPVVLLVAVFQVNVLLDNIIAKTLIPGDGPVTYLNMGTSVYQLPWSVFSLALGTAALPLLSRYWALGRKEDFRKTLLSALRMAIFLAVPCTVGIMLLSEDIVRLLYGAGRFLENDAEPVKRTAGVVCYSSLGLVFFSVNALLARALYAMKDMKTPTTTSAWSVAINLSLNLIFVLGTPMRESGIALASTLSNAWQTWALARAVRRQTGTSEVEGGAEFLAQVAGAGAICAVLGVAGYQHFSKKQDWEGFWGFFAAIGFSLVPFYLIGRQYFASRLKDKPHVKDPALHARFGVPDEHWTDALKMQYSIFSTALASAIMGFMVWAVRDSLPPEGHHFVLVLQRAVVPVFAGIVVYATAASFAGAREHDELKAAFALKFERLFRAKSHSTVNH